MRTFDNRAKNVPDVKLGYQLVRGEVGLLLDTTGKEAGAVYLKTDAGLVIVGSVKTTTAAVGAIPDRGQGLDNRAFRVVDASLVINSNK